MSSANSSDLDCLRHSAAHIMAQAVQKLYPDAKLGIGPTIRDGFYYDIELDKPLTDEDLPKIEEEMKGIIKAGQTFEQSFMPRDEALQYFKDNGQDYKCKIINDLDESEKISVYKNGEFTDLCRGPHIENTQEVRAFKLLSVAGAYWRGDEKNKMLTRIYGTAFKDRKDLKAYLHRLEEAKKRDHRKLGKDLDLFSIQDELGPGLVLWHPKGARLRGVIEDYWKKAHAKAGYDYVYSPHIAKGHLWDTSGHTSFYKDGMFSPMKIDDQEYLLKPMNCPFHIMMYKTGTKSYRDLPVRLAELGTVYRNERSGTMHGLLRVRGFTQDDAHIFCTPEQLKDEVKAVLDLAFNVLETFGFTDYEIDLSVRDPKEKEKYAGTDEEWDMAEKALVECLEAKDRKFKREEGEAVFYGPKIDIKILDAIGRSWQCTTIQFDFNLPRRFDVRYIDTDGKEQYPFMVHRAIFGSLERFIGTLIEHYGGVFPLWLAPVQAVVAPITDKQTDYASDLCDKLKEAGIRAELDARNEKIGYKVRQAETSKTPYILIVGEREAEAGQVSLRGYGRRDLGVMDVTTVIDKLLNEVKLRKAE